MTRTTAGKSILIGTLVGAVLLPIISAICAAIALKTGFSPETVTTCASACAFASAFVGAFISSRMSGEPLSGAASSGIIVLILLVSALISGGSKGIFTVPIAAFAGGLAAFFLSGVKRKKAKVQKANTKIKKKKVARR